MTKWNKNKIQEWLDINSDGYSIISEYLNNHSHIQMICPNGTSFQTSWKSFHQRGNRCYCDICKTKQIKKEFYEWCDEKNRYYTIADEMCRNQTTDIFFTCKNNHIFQSKISNIKQSQGEACPTCVKEEKLKDLKQYIINYAKEYKIKNEDDFEDMTKKITFICDNKHECKISPTSFKQGRRCVTCKNIDIGNRFRTPLEDIREHIESIEGYKLVSKFYKNNETPIQVECNKGHVYTTKYMIFKQGCRCPICKGVKKYTIEDVRKYIEIDSGSGYKLLSNIYTKNTDNNLILRCNKGHKTNMSFWNFKKGHRCWFCRNINNSGENNNWYKGGRTLLNKYLRESLSEWKRDILKEYSYKCYITNQTGIFEIHHVYSFYKILEETLEELGFDKMDVVSQYDNIDLGKIKELFLKKHSKDIGVPTLKDMHGLFHSIYGYEVTKNELDSFKCVYEKHGLDGLLQMKEDLQNE